MPLEDAVGIDINEGLDQTTLQIDLVYSTHTYLPEIFSLSWGYFSMKLYM